MAKKLIIVKGTQYLPSKLSYDFVKSLYPYLTRQQYRMIIEKGSDEFLKKKPLSELQEALLEQEKAIDKMANDRANKIVAEREALAAQEKAKK